MNSSVQRSCQSALCRAQERMQREELEETAGGAHSTHCLLSDKCNLVPPKHPTFTHCTSGEWGKPVTRHITEEGRSPMIGTPPQNTLLQWIGFLFSGRHEENIFLSCDLRWYICPITALSNAKRSPSHKDYKSQHSHFWTRRLVLLIAPPHVSAHDR